MKGGLHGDGFRYLQIEQGKRLTNFPRIIPIAGVYPEITPEQLLAPAAASEAKFGSWSYDFSDPAGPQLGTVAIPASRVMTECIDPVAVIAPNRALGVKIVEDVEMIIVIDRADRRFNPDEFFIFRTPDDQLSIQWMDEVEDGYEVMGKVITSMSPFVPGMYKEKSGFAEDDDDDEE